MSNDVTNANRPPAITPDMIWGRTISQNVASRPASELPLTPINARRQQSCVRFDVVKEFPAGESVSFS